MRGMVCGEEMRLLQSVPDETMAVPGFPKPYILAAIYFGRALTVVGFIALPASPPAAIAFGAVTVLMWLSTVLPTSGLVALMFGAPRTKRPTGNPAFSM